MADDYITHLRAVHSAHGIRDIRDHPRIEELRRQQIEREAAAEAKRKLALEIVSAGYRAISVKLRPDKSGSLADVTRLTAARDDLRRMLAPPPSIKKRKPRIKPAPTGSRHTQQKR